METTLTAIQAPLASAEGKPAPEVPALVLLWSREEPLRVGEVALLGAPEGGGTLIVGRGGGRQDLPRADFVRQRPGRNIATGPLRTPRLSRDQLLLSHAGGGRLGITNVGKLPALVNGQELRGPAEVGPGDLIELAGEALLLVRTRPLILSLGPLSPGAFHPFGEADSDGLVGEGPAAWELRGRIAFVAARGAHVLIRGESGTGKELVAQAIHRRSERGAKELIARNAATIPETLVDAELFGHARNFPNPGMPERPGLIGEADGSSLFLDEFAELPHALQAHLLRVMDQGEYQRLGEPRTRRSSFRLIAATNRPESALKHDVLARLQIRIELPGLNERREDVPLIARQLLRRIAARDPELARRFFPEGDPRGVPRLSLRLVAALTTLEYATHVRELEAHLWTAMSCARGDHLDLWEGFPPSADEDESGDAAEDDDAGAASEGGPEGERVDPNEIPPEVIQACLDRHEGRQEPVWRELGLTSRHVLTRLVRKHGLNVRGRGGR